jgi:hypothetical protein
VIRLRGHIVTRVIPHFGYAEQQTVRKKISGNLAGKLAAPSPNVEPRSRNACSFPVVIIVPGAWLSLKM